MEKKLGETHPIVDHVSARQRSGLTVEAYCRQAGITPNSYFYWRKRLMERPSMLVSARINRQGNSSAFVELGMRPAGLNGYALRFHRTGVDLLVSRGFDGAEVAALARVAATLDAEVG